MRRIVLEALRAGAIGFATSTLEQHNGENGMPDALAPGRRARDARADRRARRGGPRRVHAHQGHDVHDALAREDRRGQRPAGDDRRDVRGPRRSRPACSASSARSRQARARGRELWAQVGCFPLGMEFTLRHPYPLEAFIAWRPAIEADERGALPRGARRSVVPRRRSRRRSAQPRRAEPLQRQELGPPDHHGGAAPRAPGARRARPSATLARERGAASVGLLPRLRPRRRARRHVRLPPLQHRRERGEASSCATRTPRWRCPTRARTCPSSATPASACTSSATGRASAATSRSSRRCAR